MTIVITGSEGFIGKSFLEYLVKNHPDYTIYGIDKKERRLYKNGKCYSDPGENSYNGLISIGKETSIDYLFHFAATPGVRSEFSDLFEDNVKDLSKTVNLIKVDHPETKFIFISSSTAVPENTKSYYGVTKAYGERLVRTLLPSSIVFRLYNVFGPISRPDTLPYLASHNKELTLAYSGNIRRHFTWINDVINAIWNNKDKIGIYNVANPEEWTIYDFVKVIRNIYNPELKVSVTTDIDSADSITQIIGKEPNLLKDNATSIIAGIKQMKL